MGKLFEELKRRKVFRVAAIYAVVAWVLIQVADTIAPMMNLPESAPRLVLFLLIILFPVAVFLAWAYEITPDGVKPDSSVQASQGTPAAQPVNYIILAIVLLVAGFQVSDRFLFGDLQSDNSIASSKSSVMRLSINLDHPFNRAGSGVGSAEPLEISADGSRLYYINRYGSGPNTGGIRALQERDLTTAVTVNLSEGAGYGSPQISPDGSRLLLANRYEFSILSLESNSRQTIVVDKAGGAGGWLSNDEILYTAQEGSIYRKSLVSDLDESLTQSEAGRQGWPDGLPGGTAFLYASHSSGSFLGAGSDIKVYDLNGRNSKALIANGYMPKYATSGHIVFVRSGDLWAAPFDLDRLEVTGNEVRVVERVSSNPIVGDTSFAFSDTGRLVYAASREYGRIQLSWVDRAGNSQEIPLPPGNYEQFELSPDGNTLALVGIEEDNSTDLLVYDLNRGSFSKRTFTGNARRPKWSSDGSRLFYQLANEGIWSVNADGTGQAEPIYNEPNTRPEFYSGTEDKLHYLEGDPGSANISTLSYQDGTWQSTPLIETPFNAWGAAVSPNGQWIAFSNTETGREEIYIHTYPDIEGGKWQISTQRGREPRWNANGDELFYIVPEGRIGAKLMSVSIDVFGDGALNHGTPIELLDGFTMHGIYPPSYAVSNDGQQFIKFTRIGEGSQEISSENGVLTVVENWFEELKRLAPPDPQ